MSKAKEAAKDEWIKEIQLFQQIAETGVESYAELSKEYDKVFGKKTLAQRLVIAENAKIQRVILEVAGR